MRTLKAIGVPYTEKQLAEAQTAVQGRTEMDALIAYLQSLKFKGAPENGGAKGQP
jgi:cytochrome c oxidase cbb3-type subunit 2